MTTDRVTLMLTALRGLRNTLLAVVDQIDVVTDMATQPAESPESEVLCTHPARYRQPLATMGHATRFKCGRCGYVGED